MRTRVVNIRIESGDIFIGRPGPYGNPYKIGPDGTKDEVIEKHRQFLKGQPLTVEKVRRDLKGKVLMCFCKPLPCHGDVYIKICEGEEW